MRILLDTNVLLWALAGSPRIEAARDVILEPSNEIFVSVVSWWEIAVKTSIGKLQGDVARMRAEAMDVSGFLELPVKGGHAEALSTVPLLHRDPFDRMLVAQALSEPMRLLTGDSQLARYSELVFLI